MQTGELQIRVRYAETDQMGFVHHSNFFVYFEMGRIELLRTRSLSYKELEGKGYFLVLVHAECSYHRPARYDDLLRLRTRVGRVTAARVEHRYELFYEETLLAEGKTVLAYVDHSGSLQRIPKVLRYQHEE